MMVLLISMQIDFPLMVSTTRNDSESMAKNYIPLTLFYVHEIAKQLLQKYSTYLITLEQRAYGLIKDA